MAARDIVTPSRPPGWLGAWAGFVLALALGRLMTGGGPVALDELTVGLPVAWLATRPAAVRVTPPLLLVPLVAGLLIGLLA